MDPVFGRQRRRVLLKALDAIQFVPNRLLIARLGRTPETPEAAREGAFLERFVAWIEAPEQLRLDRLFPAVPAVLAALRRRGDRLVLLNNDTVVPNGWLPKLLRHLEPHGEARERRPEPVLSEAYAHLSVDGLREYRRALSIGPPAVRTEGRKNPWTRKERRREDLSARHPSAHRTGPDRGRSRRRTA